MINAAPTTPKAALPPPVWKNGVSSVGSHAYKRLQSLRCGYLAKWQCFFDPDCEMSHAKMSHAKKAGWSDHDRLRTLAFSGQFVERAGPTAYALRRHCVSLVETITAHEYEANTLLRQMQLSLAGKLLCSTCNCTRLCTFSPCPVDGEQRAHNLQTRWVVQAFLRIGMSHHHCNPHQRHSDTRCSVLQHLRTRCRRG